MSRRGWRVQRSKTTTGCLCSVDTNQQPMEVSLIALFLIHHMTECLTPRTDTYSPKTGAFFNVHGPSLPVSHVSLVPLSQPVCDSVYGGAHEYVSSVRLQMCVFLQTAPIWVGGGRLGRVGRGAGGIELSSASVPQDELQLCLSSRP